MAVMVDKETKEAVPVTAFLNADTIAKDVAKVNDAARGKWLSIVGMALALLRNYDPFKSPTHFKFTDLLKKFDKTFGATGKNYGKVSGRPHRDRHREAPPRSLELPVHRRHVVPGPVQLRFPPHRAVHHSLRHAGRRDLLLRLQHRRGLAQYRREDAHDRHAHQVVRGARPARDLRRRQEGRPRDHGAHAESGGRARHAEANDTLDKLGIAKNARQEKFQARDAKVKAEAEKARMMALYKEHVLGEKPAPKDGFIPSTASAASSRPSPRSEEREAVYGD